LEKLSLSMTLADCLSRFPQLKEHLHSLIEECIYCEGFMNEPLEVVFKAHRLDPQKSLRKLLTALEEKP
jgi:hypothetical protein